jgi:Na+-translocating ferredoxin:NAD+ oxidoreductase RnfD subunit
MSLNLKAYPEETITQRKIMIMAIGLLLMLVSSTVIFGLQVIFLAITATVFALMVEFLFAKFRKLPLDPAWMITPLLVTLMMPPTSPLWMVAIGSSFGVFFGKAVFGGYGKHIFNPAVVGILFLYFAFPSLMLTKWLNPVTQDVVAAATPLITLNRNLPFEYSLMQLLLGNVPGTIGETFRLGVLVIGAAFMVLKVIDWRVPASYLGTVFLLNLLGGFLWPNQFRDPVLSLMVGGLLFGAFFVASDPITTPQYPLSKLFYGFGLGVITVIIRNFATFPEGVVFAVIIMSAVSPLLDSMKIVQKRQEDTV